MTSSTIISTFERSQGLAGDKHSLYFQSQSHCVVGSRFITNSHSRQGSGVSDWARWNGRQGLSNNKQGKPQRNLLKRAQSHHLDLACQRPSALPVAQQPSPASPASPPTGARRPPQRWCCAFPLAEPAGQGRQARVDRWPPPPTSTTRPPLLLCPSSPDSLPFLLFTQAPCVSSRSFFPLPRRSLRRDTQDHQLHSFS